MVYRATTFCLLVMPVVVFALRHIEDDDVEDSAHGKITLMLASSKIDGFQIF